MNKRSVVIVLSDLFDEVDALMAGLEHFRHRRHDVIVFHVLDPQEIEFSFAPPHDVPGAGADAARGGRSALAAARLPAGIRGVPAHGAQSAAAATDWTTRKCAPIDRSIVALSSYLSARAARMRG